MDLTQDVAADAANGAIFQSNLPLREKLERARMELLDLSASNRLLNMPRGARSSRSIEVIDEKTNEIFRLLVREGRAFTFVAGVADSETGAQPNVERTAEPVAEPDEVAQLAQPNDDSMDERGVLRRHADTRLQTRLTGKGLQKRLLELYLDSRTLEEEQGVNVLFLTLGALKWVDPNNATKVRYAPLLLVPVQLDRGNAGERFNLKVRQEDFAQNLSLEAYLDRLNALTMPAFEANDSFDPMTYIENVRDCVQSKLDWEVLPDDMSVGFFSFAKFLMYRDLDPDVWPQDIAISDHPLIRGLLSEGFPGSEGMVHEDTNIDALIPPAKMVHILDCDSSQALAIHEVRQGRNLVIQGPPGTGKSQTIANIIASAIKDGKTVLFVAEKMAALEVVKRRLDDKGVGDACLELHSNRANKRAVLEELRRTWELGAPRAPDPGNLFKRLTEARDELNAHAQRLHEIDAASELSPYQVMGQLTRLRQAGEKPNDINLDAPEQWGRDGYLQRQELLADLASRVVEIGKPSDHAWVGVRLDSILPADAERLIGRVHSLLTRLTAAQSNFDAAAALLEREPPQCLTDIPPLVELLLRIAQAPTLSAAAMSSDVWRQSVVIDTLISDGRSYDDARTALEGRVHAIAWEADLTETTQAFAELPDAFGPEMFQRLEQVAELLPRLLTGASALATALGREPGSTLADFEKLILIGERVATAPPASPESFASDLWDGGVDRAWDLANAVAKLESARSTIGNQLTETAWDADLASARAMLAARGTSFLRFLSGEWRAANRLVRSVVSSPNQSLPITLGLLDALARGQAAKRAIEDEDIFGRSAFGKDWRGGRSNAAPLVALVEWMRSLKGLGAEPRLIVSRGPEKAEIAARAQQLSELSAKAKPKLKVAWQDLAKLRTNFSDVAEVSAIESADLASLLQLGVRYTLAQSFIRRLMLAPPGLASESMVVLEQLAAGQVARKAVRDGETLGKAAFDRAWEAENSRWAMLTEASQWVATNDEIRALAGRVVGRESLVPLAKLLGASQAHVLTSFRALADELSLDIEVSVGAALDDAPTTDIASRLQRWVDEHEQLFRWVNYRDKALRASAQGCKELVERLADGRLPPDRVVRAFEMAYFEATYARLVRAKPQLGRFDGATHGGVVRKFAQLDRERIAAASGEVVKAHHSRVPPRDGGAMGPVGVLRGEIQKKRGHISVRKLVERAGPALRALKPVFMMSPLSVAQFLVPGTMKFDLLVMDEASQIQPVDALGAIARADQVVVVGDPKQLPPTSFFAKMTATNDGDDDDDATPVANIESILGLFTARGLPMRMLRWHYRSRHQSLIAVSNRQFYENKLFIVPSPYMAHEGRGLQFHYIHNGLFDSGNKRNNVIEAKAVAQAIIAHARSHPKLSLGVAAFSAAQRRAIIDELEMLRRGLSPEVEEFFKDHRAEPFFVKNLENVQGDERDVIFISVGYGRSVPGGRVPMRFGPLGTEGGERRLNVLISRAKQRCDVFASMTDEDIEASYAAGKKGVYSFKLFLQYARTGRMPMAEATGRDYDSGFEEEVADALRTCGYEVEPQVGMAGFFIDLAIVDAERPGRYLLGIECDGAAYHSSRSARDRDRLRQMVLEEHGWTIHRIWSTDWFQRPSEQLDLVIKRIEAAKAEFDEHHHDVGVAKELDAEAPYIDREPAASVESEDAGFIAYGEVVLTRPTRRPVDLHETAEDLLVDLVVRAAKVEGPVHVDQVLARVRDAWGLRRSGSRMEDVVTKAIKAAAQMGRVTLTRDFISAPGSKPVARDRSNVAATSLRKPEMLPPAEIEVALMHLIRKNLGATREQATQAVARGLGIRATSGQVRAIIEAVIGEALQARKLVEIAGVLTVTEVGT